MAVNDLMVVSGKGVKFYAQGWVCPLCGRGVNPQVANCNCATETKSETPDLSFELESLKKELQEAIGEKQASPFQVHIDPMYGEINAEAVKKQVDEALGKMKEHIPHPRSKPLLVVGDRIHLLVAGCVAEYLGEGLIRIISEDKSNDTVIDLPKDGWVKLIP